MIFAWVQNELNLHKLKSVCKLNSTGGGRERVFPLQFAYYFSFPLRFPGHFPLAFPLPKYCANSRAVFGKSFRNFTAGNAICGAAIAGGHFWLSKIR